MGRLEKQLFQLKLSAKTLEMSARKCLKVEEQEKSKLKKALQQGNIEVAQVYAANSVRKKHEHLNLIRLASRVDAVASRVQTAINMRSVTKDMSSVVSQMERAMKSMNLEKVQEIMGKFETQFDNLDVQIAGVDTAISSSTATTTPQLEIDGLMRQVADENGVELSVELSIPVANAQVSEADQENLGQRLSKLRNTL